MSQYSERRVTAVLGPTNTGKTYLAIERMLGHRSGTMGFPLRLLARENYDRVVALKGERQAALVTGEEKIVPPSARYFLCTVESMPLDRPAAFLGVDEIQLCADAERGHVFTDRLLHARGEEETMFLGAETARPLVQALVPEAEIVTRPRFSTLSYAGTSKLTRLPPRSAVVAFSAAEVYAIAELVRRQRGGTAVVLGALSPRTRNAQVAMFEAGEVDYLVATDAIGMGLNLSLDHVSFARLEKFDGQSLRRLTPAELAQIAGRAGRHMSDGTFGTTNEIGPLPADLVEAVEEHRFDPLHAAYWRNRQLDFRSTGLLLKSLERQPPAPELIKVRRAEDMTALQALARDPEIAALTGHAEAVRLLWEVCQIPDYQKILSDQHAKLLSRIYRYLMAGEGHLPEDWVARQIKRLDRSDGDIDALAARIAFIRTWTYVTHRGDWLADNAHWQERARRIEDKLSDALHERLTQRFVDKRAALLVRRLRAGDELLAAIKPDGQVLVEGAFAGRLEGFRFRLDESVEGEDAKRLFTAARRVLVGEIPARVKRLEDDADNSFALGPEGEITWHGAEVARLKRGESALKPGVEPLPSEFLDGRARERLRQRLSAWLRGRLERELEPLFALAAAAQEEALAGPPRGLVYQLVEALGLLPRRQLAAQIHGLKKADRKALAGLGVRLGRESVYLPALIEPGPARLRALLWAVRENASPPAVPGLGAPALILENGLGEELCRVLGYRYFACGEGAAVALRADVLERLSYEAYKLSGQGPFTLTPRLRRLSGCGETELESVLGALGYRAQRDTAGLSFTRRGGRKTHDRNARGRRGAGGEKTDSPFAKLRGLSSKT